MVSVQQVSNMSNSHQNSHSLRDAEFSSEHFKIQIDGLPKHFAVNKLKGLVNKTLQLDSHKVKAGGRLGSTAFINFKNEDSRNKALGALNGYIWNNCQLSAKKACPPRDPVVIEKCESKRMEELKSVPLERRMLDSVIPLHDVSYEMQLKKKQRNMYNLLRKLSNRLSHINCLIYPYLKRQKAQHNGLVCELSSIVKSPVTEGYRNKCEFSIGMSRDSKPIVGFRMASYKKGSVEVGPVRHMKHIPHAMKKATQAMEDFLATSPYKPFDQVTHEGVWRQLTIRTSNQQDLLLIVVMHPQDFSDVQIEAIKNDVIDYFCNGPGSSCGVTSVFFEVYGQRLSGVNVECVHGWGKMCIEEKILGKTLQAGPDSFLQVNTLACEEVYKTIIEMATINSRCVVLDICCGVGSIGLAIAERAHHVYGVDTTESSIALANKNAKLNGIENATFYHGKAEDFIGVMLERAASKKVVAIVDPPRAGLHNSVMAALRKCYRLDRIVYVSCDPEAAMRNFEALARPRSKKFQGNCFVPTRATPIDLFPHTPHNELLILFERFDELKSQVTCADTDVESECRISELSTRQSDATDATSLQTTEDVGQRGCDESTSLAVERKRCREQGDTHESHQTEKPLKIHKGI